jgi:tricarballylate dehydrogenase
VAASGWCITARGHQTDRARPRDADIARTDFGEYSAEEYLDDLGRITQYYIDPDLAETLVTNSTDTVHWLMGRGVKFLPNYGRQAYNHEGRFKFFGGIVIYANGGGAGLVESEYKAAAKNGIAIHYAMRAMALLRGPKGVEGVRVAVNGAEETIRAKAVVLSCGGFEANREWRARYLGPGWDMAKVRGTRYNTGDGIRMALDIGARPTVSGRVVTLWPGNAMPATLATMTTGTPPVIATATPLA